MTNKAFQYYKELPTWAKGVVAIGGIAIIFFTTKSILNRIRLHNQGKKDRQSLRIQEKELNDFVQGGTKQTYPNSQYSTWASQLKQQFDGCDGSFGRPILQFIPPTWLGNIMWSNSGALTANIFEKLKNNVDFLKLQTAFGIATYDKCGLWNGDFTGNLTSAIADELDEQERNAINKILKSNGLTYNV